MAACDCAGCGGHSKHVEMERIRAERNRQDFEAWLAAGKPDIRTWHSKRAERDAEAEKLLAAAGL